MKFRADRATLLRALAHVQSVVEKRNTIPILANVMLRVGQDAAQASGHGGGRAGLTLTATDMEIALIEEVAASTGQDGVCTAPAATLYEIVRRLPDSAELEFDYPSGDGQLALRAGRYATRLLVLPAEDFPVHDRGRPAAQIPAGRANLARGDRPHEVRHLHRGDALLPERHFSARRRRSRRQDLARGRHRRAPLGARTGGAAAGRGDWNARRDRAAQDGGRVAQADRRDQQPDRSGAVRDPHPVPHRPGHADQQADRRDVPRIRAGDPARQRQNSQCRQKGVF